MVFVHARNATVRTGMKLMELASNRGHTQHFLPEDSAQYGQAQKAMSKSRNKQVINSCLRSSTNDQEIVFLLRFFLHFLIKVFFLPCRDSNQGLLVFKQSVSPLDPQ